METRLGLTGKTALIAGGGGGLGRACAFEFARAGARLSICDRDKTLLAEVESMIAADGGDVATMVADVTELDQLRAFYALNQRTYGGVDIVVNAVGLPLPESFTDSNTQEWDTCILANYTWILHSMRLACDPLRAAGGGSIINFTTIEAHRSAPGNAVYAGAKAAVTHASRTLAVELAPFGIRVNTIAPDMTPTERPRTVSFTARPNSEQGAIGAQYAVPLGRLGRYEDISGCALFLASDLSAYVTGQTLHADGGTYASSGWTYWPGSGGYGSSGFLPIPPQHVMDYFTDSGFVAEARPRSR